MKFWCERRGYTISARAGVKFWCERRGYAISARAGVKFLEVSFRMLAPGDSNVATLDAI